MQETFDINLLSHITAMDGKTSISKERPSLRQKGPKYGRKRHEGGLQQDLREGGKDSGKPRTPEDDNEDHGRINITV